MHGKRIKNIFIKNWPKKVADNIEVFDTFYMYIKGVGVLDDDAHKKIYNLLNIDIKKDLRDQDYTGIDNVYLYLKSYDTTNTLTNGELAQWINNAIALNTETHTARINWTSELEPSRSTLATNQEIIDKIATTPYAFTWSNNVASATEGDWPEDALGLAILDSDQVLFQREVRVVSRSVSKVEVAKTDLLYDTKTTTKYKLNAALEIKYKRVIFAGDPITDAYLDKVVSIVNSFPDWKPDKSIAKSVLYDIATESKTHPINQQLLDMYLQIHPLTDTLLHDQYGNIKVSGVENLKVKEFAELLPKIVESGYTETPAKWYEKILVAVLVVIVIVAAVLTGGAAASGLTGVAAVAAFSASFALIVTIGSVILSIAQGYLMKKGKYALGGFIGRSVKFLGVLSTIAGVVAMVTGIAAAWQKAKEAVAQKAKDELKKQIAKEALTDIGKDVAIEAVEEIALDEIETTVMDTAMEMISQTFASATKSTASIIQSVISTINQGFQLYVQYVEAPKEEEELEAKQAELEAQEKELENMTRPDGIDQVNRYLDDPFYNWVDQMTSINTAQMCRMMTEDKVVNKFDKYYDSGT